MCVCVQHENRSSVEDKAAGFKASSKMRAISGSRWQAARDKICQACARNFEWRLRTAPRRDLVLCQVGSCHRPRDVPHNHPMRESQPSFSLLVHEQAELDLNNNARL